MDNRLIYFMVAITLFVSGYTLHSYTHTCIVAEPEVITEYKDRVETKIAYVPKETIVYKNGSAGTEKTDVDMNIGKQSLNVMVNGKEMTIDKTDDEKFVFDKNKLSFTQTSRSDLRIDVPTVDNTKQWEIGLGASKDGVVGFVGFPVKENLGGWVAGNEDYQMGGIMIRF